jgi:chromosome segregation ATPase
MKHEMDAYAKVMEKEKIELQSKLEEEIARRELTWAVKLDRIRSEERDLHERVTNLQEENSYIQREISTLLSRDGNTNGKIKELESQVDSYRVRAEQAKANLDALHQAYAEKEAETCNLRKIVERLPELCGDYDPDYEKRMSTLQQNLQDGRVQDTSAGNRKPSKLQRELCRLSSLEVALRSEMQVLKGSTLGYGDTTVDEYTAAAYGQSNIKELHAELDRLQSHTGELQDDNNILSVKLRLIVREKEEMRKALRDAEEEIHELREEQQRRSYGQEEHGQESSEISQGDGDHELEGDADSQVLYVFY